MELSAQDGSGVPLADWLTVLAADRGVPWSAEGEAVARALAAGHDRAALHLVGRRLPARAAPVLDALGEPDALVREVRLVLALLPDEAGAGMLAEPLVTLARAFAVGGVLWPEAKRPALTTVVAWLEAILPPPDEVRTMWAGAPGSRRRWAVVEQYVAGAIGRLAPEVESAVGEIEPHAPGLAERLRARWSSIKTRAFVWPFSGQPAEPGPADLARDRAAAVDWLLARPGWPGSVDRQRWGVVNVEGELLGAWFPGALIELALAEMGQDRRAAMVAIVDELPADGPRYYAGWPHIPVDADCLGVGLRLARATGRSAIGERWLRRLPEDGTAPVWLYSGDPAERAVRWPGADCLASRLSLAEGLAAWDAARFSRVIDALVTEAGCAIRGDRVGGAVYYPDVFTTAQYLRLAPSSDARCRALVDRLCATQRGDGGFGSPLDTALLGAALALRGALTPSGLTRVARFLGETQAGDGSWAAEPVYFTPGKPGLMRPHQGKALSTAFCGAALAAIEWSLAGDERSARPGAG